MTKAEAKQQVEAFFKLLGENALVFEEKKYVQVRLGETFIGFEYEETEEILSVQSLIYRFRSSPKDQILDAIFAEEDQHLNGGGRLVFDSEAKTFYLQKDFSVKLNNEEFYREINDLAQATLTWSREILAVAAEKANQTNN